jgi:hypothetical protein
VTDRSDSHIGWILSLMVHGLLIMAFVMTNFELKPFDLDYTPVTFAPLAEIKPGGGPTSPKWGGAQPLVELPKRPMLNETSPLLKLPESNRQAVIAPVTSGKPNLSSLESLHPGQRMPLQAIVSGKKERAPIKPVPISDAALYGQRTDIVGDQLANEDMFTLAWDGPARVRTSGITPEFPVGLNNAATVRLELIVAPDGSVISVRPLTKGLPQLEQVSIAALKTWRFNSLDKGLAQQNQKGIITFIFQLN